MRPSELYCPEYRTYVRRLRGLNKSNYLETIWKNKNFKREKEIHPWMTCSFCWRPDNDCSLSEYMWLLKSNRKELKIQNGKFSDGPGKVNRGLGSNRGVPRTKILWHAWQGKENLKIINLVNKYPNGIIHRAFFFEVWWVLRRGNSFDRESVDCGWWCLDCGIAWTTETPNCL